MDTFRTIAEPSEGLFKDKGSRFLAFAFPVRSADEVKTLVDEHRRRFHDARHVCYAYVIGADRAEFRANDDGEPSGTAGRPILGQINSNDLTDILVIVVRYFGGILLGTGGLIVAYKAAAAAAIESAEVVERIVESTHTIAFDYDKLSAAMNLMKRNELTILEQKMEMRCEIRFSVRKSMEEAVLQQISQIFGIELIY